MKHCCYLFLIALFWMACGASPEQNAAPEADAATAVDASPMEGPNPAMGDTAVFEARAQQKARDFLELATLIASQEADPAFKTQAREMLLGLFASDSVKVPTQLIACLEQSPAPVSLQALLVLLEANNLMLEALEGPADQAGSLATVVLPVRASCANAERSLDLWVQFSWQLKPVEKSFGSTTESSWEVVLGNIQAIEAPAL